MTRFSDKALEPIAEKILAGQRLDAADAIVLAESPDLTGLGALANRTREERHGDKVYYNINRHIDYSNVCVADCRFCAFSRAPGEDGGWTRSLEEIFRIAGEELPPDCSELHIVGGLHPDLRFAHYVEMIAGLRERCPHLHLKAFSAVELDHFAKVGGLEVRETVRQLKAAGLDSLPGGGAEIFDEALRREICPDKAGADRWLEIHRVAHEEGLRSNATMLYGHLESWPQRVDHMLRLRKLQDETGGFQAFIPLAFHPRNSGMADLPGPSGLLDLRMFAVSRLVLDNLPHIKAYWISLGIKMAQVALSFGADDLDGTVGEETIHHMAGAESPRALSPRDLESLIREAGRQPVLRDSLYETSERT
jgi:aminodeoxyfutalosine synthase